MRIKAPFLSILALLLPFTGYCSQNDTPSSRIYQNGAEVIIDGSTHVTGALRSDKYVELVAKSTVTIPSLNHARIYLSSTTPDTICAIFDNNTTTCFGAAAITGVTPGFGLTGGGTAGNVTLNLNGGTSSYIQNTLVPQTATFTVTGGRVYGNFVATGTVTLGSSSAGVTISSSASMSGFGINNLANGVVSTDAATFGQLHMLQIPKWATEVVGSSTTSGSFISGGISNTITPTTTTSKIVIWVIAPTSTNNAAGTVILGINGTATGDLFTTTTSPSRNQGTTIQTGSLFAIDTPGTTTTQTYKLRLATNGVTANIGNLAAAGAQTMMLLMEVQ